MPDKAVEAVRSMKGSEVLLKDDETKLIKVLKQRHLLPKDYKKNNWRIERSGRYHETPILVLRGENCYAYFRALDGENSILGFTRVDNFPEKSGSTFTELVFDKNISIKYSKLKRDKDDKLHSDQIELSLDDSLKPNEVFLSVDQNDVVGTFIHRPNARQLTDTQKACFGGVYPNVLPLLEGSLDLKKTMKAMIDVSSHNEFHLKHASFTPLKSPTPAGK